MTHTDTEDICPDDLWPDQHPMTGEVFERCTHVETRSNVSIVYHRYGSISRLIEGGPDETTARFETASGAWASTVLGYEMRWQIVACGR